MKQTIIKTKTDFEVVKQARFSIERSPRCRPHLNEPGAPCWFIVDDPAPNEYDISFWVDGEKEAEYPRVPEAELDNAIGDFQRIHGKHEMIQVLPSGEERHIDVLHQP